MKIAIIGAGIAGLLPAYYLAKQGIQVSIYEEESYAARRCSYANGGQVSVCNSEVWNNWHTVLKGIKWLFKRDAPLLVRPQPDLDKIKWMFNFVKQTAKNEHQRKTIETIKLGLESRRLYQELIAQEELQFDQSSCGILHFYKSTSEFDRARQLKDLFEEHGCEWQIVDAQQAKSIEPSLDHLHDLVGGVWTPSDWTGDIHKFCTQLADRLTTKYQVKIYYDRPIGHIEDLVGYDYIVVAAGISSRKFARQVGVDLGIYPVKGYSVTMESENLPRVSLLDDQAKIVTSSLGSRLRVAGTAELSGENYDIRYDRIQPLLGWTKTNLPNVHREHYTSWACLRPMSYDMMPVVGFVRPGTNVIFHTGHGHLGWTLSPATSQYISELIFNR